MALVDPHWPRADAWLASDHPDARLLVVGVPSSKASLSPSRADLTPGAVRDRLSRFSTYHGEMDVDLGALSVRDLGNWPVSELDMHEMPGEVRSRAAALPSLDLVAFLGGDNAITRPLVASRGPDLSKVGVITFDAHHDVRSLGNGPTNGTPIRGLIEEEGLPGESVAQIGIHSFANSAAYRSYCDEKGIGIFTVADVERLGVDVVVESALNRLRHCDWIHVDVDVDVLDRSFAPGCPGARPGGLTVRQLATGVARCTADPRVRAIDFVEVDAAADVGHQTLDILAHLFLTAAAGLARRL